MCMHYNGRGHIFTIHQGETISYDLCPCHALMMASARRVQQLSMFKTLAWSAMGNQKTRLECGYQWRHIGKPGEPRAKLAEKPPTSLELYLHTRVTHDLVPFQRRWERGRRGGVEIL